MATPIGNLEYPGVFNWLFSSQHTLPSWDWRYIPLQQAIGGVLFVTCFVFLAYCHFAKHQFALALANAIEHNGSANHIAQAAMSNNDEVQNPTANNFSSNNQKNALHDFDDEKEDTYQRPRTRADARVRRDNNKDPINDNNNQQRHKYNPLLSDHNHQQRVLQASPFVQRGPFSMVQFPEILPNILMHLGYFLCMTYPYTIFHNENTAQHFWQSPLSKWTGLTSGYDSLYFGIVTMCCVLSCILSCREVFQSHREYFKQKRHILHRSNIFVKYVRDTPQFIPRVC